MMSIEVLNTTLTPTTLFQFSSQVAMLGWAILIFFPRGLKLISIIPKYLIPLGLSLLYSILILLSFFTTEGGFNSLEDVRTLFQSDQALLAGWIHYLAFDLFIGAWIAQKSDAIGLSRVLQAPILITTFMLGPIGLLMFLVIRGLSTAFEGVQNVK